MSAGLGQSLLAPSVAVQKFAILGSQVTGELRNWDTSRPPRASSAMKRVSRRSFLAASAAASAAPALAQQRSAPRLDADVIIVGAGAAGIAAARRLVAG